MKLKGILHKTAPVELTKKEISLETPPESVYKDYLGGHGLGAYYLFTPSTGSEPLDPKNILGFLPRPSTETQIVGGNRFAVLAKIPKR